MKKMMKWMIIFLGRFALLFFFVYVRMCMGVACGVWCVLREKNSYLFRFLEKKRVKILCMCVVYVYC